MAKVNYTNKPEDEEKKKRIDAHKEAAASISSKQNSTTSKASSGIKVNSAAQKVSEKYGGIPVNTTKGMGSVSKGAAFNKAYGDYYASQNKKWYSGATPTGREMVARIYEVSNGDSTKFNELMGEYDQLRSDRGSVVYNPYAQVTNYKAIQGLADNGIEVPEKITSDWLNSMWQQYGQYSRETATGYGPASPTNSSSRENNIAYWIDTLRQDEENTSLAEQQLNNLYNEVKYWTDLGYSDSEVIKHVQTDFGKKYNVLGKMDEERFLGGAVRLNRAVNYSGEDTMYGMIWAARNNGGTGDYFADSVKYTMGQGNRYKANPDSEAARDPSNYEGYHPYYSGGTLHELNQKYGVTSIDQKWLDDNRWMLNDPDKADDYREYQEAFEFSGKASTELAALDQWLAKEIEKLDGSEESRKDLLAKLKAYVTDGGELSYRDEEGKPQTVKLSSLSKMEDDRKNGLAAGTAYAIDFTLPRYIDKVNDAHEAKVAAAPAEEGEQKPSYGVGGFLSSVPGVILTGGLGAFVPTNLGKENKDFTKPLEKAIKDARKSHTNLTDADYANIYLRSKYGVELAEGAELTEAEAAAVKAFAKEYRDTKLFKVGRKEEDEANAALDAMDAAFAELVADKGRVVVYDSEAKANAEKLAEEEAAAAAAAKEAAIEEAKKNAYKDSAAYTSVVGAAKQREEEADLYARGMAKGELTPQAYVRDAGVPSGAAGSNAPVAGFNTDEWTAMLAGDTEWNGDLFETALSVSDDPDAVWAELIDGINAQMMGEEGNAISQSWMRKFAGITRNTKARYSWAPQVNYELSKHDSRAAYGPEIKNALVANEKAFDMGAISKQEYLANLVNLSSTAEIVQAAAGGKKINAKRSAEILASGDGSLGAGVAALEAYCNDKIAVVEQQQAEEDAATRSSIVAARDAADAGTMDDSQSMINGIIMAADVSSISGGDKTYKKYSRYIEARAPGENSYADLQMQAGDPNSPANTIGGYDALYNRGVSALAMEVLDRDMHYAAALGISLDEYYEEFPELAKSPEQMMADAQEEFDRKWKEFGNTPEALQLVNEFFGIGKEEASGEDGEAAPEYSEFTPIYEDGLTFADIFANATSKFANDFDMNLAKAMHFFSYDLGNEQEKLGKIHNKYGTDPAALREAWDKTLLDDRVPDDVKAEIRAKLDTAASIYDLGDPDELISDLNISEFEQVGKQYDDIVAANGNEFEKFVYQVIAAVENMVTMMATAAAGGMYNVSSYITSLISMAPSEYANAYDYTKQTGDANSAFLWATAALSVTAKIEQLQMDRYLSPSASKWDDAIWKAKFTTAKQGVFKTIFSPGGLQTLVKAAGATVVKGASNAAGEAGEEFSQSLVDSFAKHRSLKDKKILTKEDWKQAGIEGLYGGVLGFAAGGAAGGSVGDANYDYLGSEIANAEKLLTPEEAGNLINDAIDFESTIAAIQTSGEQLMQLQESAENKAVQQAEEALDAAEQEVNAINTELEAKQDAQANAALAVENANLQILESDAYTEDMAKQMEAAATALQEANNEVKALQEKKAAADAKAAEIRADLDGKRAVVQAKYREIMDAAKAKAEQEIADKYYNGSTEEQKAESEKYRNACKQLAEARKALREAKLQNGENLKLGRALVAVDKLVAEVEAAKAEVDEAFANTPEGAEQIAQREELEAATQAAQQAAAEAEADQMNTKKQAAADVAQTRLEAVKAKQELEKAKASIRERLNSKSASVRAEAVAEWQAAQERANAAAQAAQDAEALYNETDPQKRLREAVAEAKKYTSEQLLFDDVEGHADAVAAYNAMQMAMADANVETARAEVEAAEVGTPEHDAAMRKYDAAVEAREDEIGRQIGKTGDYVRETLMKTSLGTQVLEAVQKKDGRKAAKVIKNILDSGFAEAEALAKQAVTQRTPFQLLADAQTGAKGKAGVTRAYSKKVKLNSAQSMQLRVLDALAKDTGFEIVVKDSLSNVEGAVNGVLSVGGTIYVGLDAVDQGYLQAGTHEIVHGIKVRSVEAFNELKGVVTDILADKGVSIDELIANRIERYGKLGQTLSEDGALEEVVAEATAQIWSNKDNMTKFAKEHVGLFKDMAEGFMKFWQKIKDIASSIATKNRNAESQALLGDDSALQKVYDTFMEVARQAGVEVDAASEQMKLSVNADLYNISREQYNKWGWTTRNDVLHSNELNEFVHRNRKEFKGENPGVETSDGLWALPIGKEHGIDNIVVISDMNFLDPDIARVYRIDSKYEDILERVRDFIYAAEEAFGGESFEIYQDLFETQAVSFYSKENYLQLYEDRRYLGGEGVESGRVGKRFEGLLERKRRNSASGVDGPVDSYSLNDSAWNEEIAKDLADQLMNNTGNAGKIAEILSRMGDNMWADHRTPALTGQQTVADQNPIEILADLTSRIGVGYNPGGTMSTARGYVPKAVQGFYQEKARSITTRTNAAGDLVVGLHEFGHAAHTRLPGLQANQQLLDGLSAEVKAQYSASEINGEAIAEFVVDYVYSRDEAVRQAGEEFVLQFEERLRNDSELNAAITEAAQQVSLWNNATAESRLDAMIKYGADPKRGQIGSWLTRFARSVETGVFDYTAPASMVSRDFRQKALYSSHAGRRAEISLTRHMIDPKGRNIGKSLAERLYDTNVTEKDMPEVVRVALARHALDRRAQNKDVFTPAEFSTKELESIVNNAPENIVAGADAITSFWNDYMDAWWVGTGMIDRASVQKMREMYPHYVPTIRVMNDNAGQYGGKSAKFQMKGAVKGGSSLEVINPIASIVKMTQQMTNTVTQNELMRAFHAEFQKGGLGDIANDVSQQYRKQRTNTADIEQALEAIKNTGSVDPALMDDAFAAVLAAQEQWCGTGQNNAPGVVSGVDQYGTPFFYEIKKGAQGLYNLLSGNATRSEDVGFLLDAVKKFKNTFTKLTTGSNPIFALKNAERDIQSSVNTGTWALTYADGMVKWIGALRGVLTNEAMFQEWTDLGGGSQTRINTALNTKDANALAKELGKELFRGKVNRKGEFAVRKTVLEKISNVLTLEQFNNAIENASRYAEYKYGKHDLSTPEGRMEAFMRSQDVTTNFGTHGANKLIRIANQAVPFMNATLQGLNKDVHIVADLFSSDPNVRKQAAPKAAKTVMNTALTAALQLMLLKLVKGNDDDEDYAILTQDMRIGNLIIPIPKGVTEVMGNATGFDKPYIRIPIAQGPLARGVYAVALDAMANVADYGPMEVNLWQAAKTILSDVVPDGTVFQGITDTMNNRTWWGGAIESDYMRENYSEGNRYDSDTPQAVISLARKIGTSPAKLDYLLGQYGGFAGKIIMPFISPDGRTGEWSLGGAGRNVVNSVLKNYTIDPVSSNDLSSNYTAAKDIINQIIGDGKNGMPINNIAYSTDPAEAYAAAKYLSDEFKAIDKEIASLWSEYNYLKESDLPTGEASRRMREIRRDYINPKIEYALALYEEYKMEYIDNDTLAQEISGWLPGGLEHQSLD